MKISSHPVKTTEEVSRKKGGLRTLPFVIANEAFEKVASFGLQANMIVYLKNEYHITNAAGTNVLFLWKAISDFTPAFGAFLSDSYLGRYRVIALATFATLLGMLVLLLTAIFPQLRPPYCDPKGPQQYCLPAKPAHFGLLFLSFALMSIGAGGIRPCSMAFGADQFNRPENPKNEKVLQTFFNGYYVSVGISVMLSVTVIVYIQTELGWVVGFAVPLGLMLLSAAMFFLGSPLYIKVRANKSLITGFAQVISAAVKNRHFDFPANDSSSDVRYHHMKGSKSVAPTEKIRRLNKACVIRNQGDINEDGTATDPWNLCTVQQVEELKAVIKVLPIWSSGFMIAVTISQHTFPVLQAVTMNRRLTNNFEIPPSSYGVFAILSLTIWIAIYDRLLVPLLAAFTKNPKGLSYKQRMGIGLVISCVAMAVSAIVERTRRARAITEGKGNQPYELVHMSAMWLVPQHCLTGIAEAFNAIGQINFYYSQFPKSMASIGVALFSVGLGVGNLLGSLIVTILSHVTKRNGNSWVSNNINMGHYDYYYWLLTFLSVVNFFYYVVVSWLYGYEEEKVWDDDDDDHDRDGGKDQKGSGEDIVKAQGSPILFSA